MRHDHQPYWLKRSLTKLNAWHVDWRVRPQFEQAGEDLRVMNPGHLQLSGTGISAGRHVHIMALPDAPVRLASFMNLGTISIGDYTIVNPGVRVSSASNISIGPACMLAMNCYLSDADWHDKQHRIYAPGATAPVTLAENVWIGDSALVCKGVTIGENSIVGAYSVVTHDVPANTIVAGSPARKIGDVDPSDITSRRDLFSGTESYADFEDAYLRDTLAGNTLVSWLRQLLLPNHHG